MMVIAYVPILVAIFGGVLWFGSKHAKVSEAGRILFAIGCYLAVSTFAARVLRLG